MTYSSVQRIVLNKKAFKVNSSSIFEYHVMNGTSNYNIECKAGFGYKSGNSIVFVDTPELERIGNPLPGESIFPDGNIKFTQKCYDASKDKNVKFYAITGHLRYNTYGEFVMDSYKYVNISITEAVPPLGLVKQVTVNDSTVEVGDSIQVGGVIANGGGAGKVKWISGVAYKSSTGEITFIDGKSESKTLTANQQVSFTHSVKITADMREKERTHGVKVYLVGSH